jgi:hypothetical protein
VHQAQQQRAKGEEAEHASVGEGLEVLVMGVDAEMVGGEARIAGELPAVVVWTDAEQRVVAQHVPGDGPEFES